MDPGKRLLERILAKRPELAPALSGGCFQEGDCAPTLISRVVLTPLCGWLWAMARYWCLCVKHAGKCEEGGECPVDPAGCAAAYVAAVVNPAGYLVRRRFYVYAKRDLPWRFYAAFARAAARLAAEASGGKAAPAIPYENLLVAAVKRFVELSASRTTGRAPPRRSRRPRGVRPAGRAPGDLPREAALLLKAYPPGSWKSP